MGWSGWEEFRNLTPEDKTNLENRRLEFELGAGFEGACGFALGLALSQMREHGLGPQPRAAPTHTGRRPNTVEEATAGQSR
jgi:hypothetical protein